MKKLLLILLLPGILLFSGCKNEKKQFEKDVARIGEAMCRSMEIMNKLKATNPDDTTKIADLQKKNEELQSEMAKLYSDFKDQYASKMDDPQFGKDFKAEIKKVMLQCKYLSNEDREKFLREAE
jgi:hypothetical protein